MRRLITLLVAMAAVLVLAAQPVAAAKPERDRMPVNEAFAEELCGVDVTTNIVGTVHVMHRADGLHVEHVRLNISWTNDDGDWLRNHVSDNIFVRETLNGEMLTIVSRNVGVHSKLRSAAGIEAAFDRGAITFTTVIDLNDPEDEEDDEVVSSTWTFHGPHPEAESNFALFCEVVNDVLA